MNADSISTTQIKKVGQYISYNHRAACAFVASSVHIEIVSRPRNLCRARVFNLSRRQRPRRLFVCRQRQHGGHQIYGYNVNETTGALTLLAGFPVASGGNGAGSTVSELLTIDRANRRLYVINAGSNTVSAYSINPATGALTALPFSPIALGAGTWATIAVHPSGSPLIVGNTSSQVNSYNITATTATAAAGSPFTTGAASPFSSVFSRSGSYYYTGGNGGTNFAGFSVNAANGVLTALAGSPFASGAAFPSGYATDSQGRFFAANDPQVRAFTTASGIPSAVSGNPFVSGLTVAVDGVLSPNENFYYVADRTGNRVGAYQIAGSGAATTLTAVAGSPVASGGTFTDALVFNTIGSFLFAANGNSRNITTYNANPTTGVITVNNTGVANTLGTAGRLTGIDYLLIQSLTVTKTADTNDGACNTDCSLREAVAAANLSAEDTVINFAIPAASCPAGVCTITLTLGALGSNSTATAGTLTITNSTGASNLLISGNNASRVFTVGNGGNLTLNGLTVTNGFANDASGAGAKDGSGIYILFGTLSLTNSAVSGNGNATRRFGGGIYNNGGTLSLTNSTVSGNTAASGGGGISSGGTLNLTSVTVAFNTASNGGGVSSLFSSATLLNTIVARNTGGSDFDGTIAAGSSSNLIGTDPRLAPLGNYGGQTLTHALLSGSPAINTGTAAGTPTTDQRGAARVGATDIGAFELNNTANGGTFIATLPDGVRNLPYDQTLVPNKGTFTYSITAGILPAGLTFNGNAFADPIEEDGKGGVDAPQVNIVKIIGTPTAGAVSQTFTVTGTDGVNTESTQYRINIAAATAASVTVGGRVTIGKNKGIRNVLVSMIDANGQVRTVLTSAFGYYRFADVAAGETYVFSVSAKKYTFDQSTQLLTVNEETEDVNFVANN